MDQVIVSGNSAVGKAINTSRGAVRGGCIVAWSGSVQVLRGRINSNRADVGGAVFVTGDASATVQQSTLDANSGGGFGSYSSKSNSVSSSTISSNFGGAIQSRDRDFSGGTGRSYSSAASNLVPLDNNGRMDVFIFERTLRTIQRINLNRINLDNGIEADGVSRIPMISASGDLVRFESVATLKILDPM